jgi:hypothetical protein
MVRRWGRIGHLVAACAFVAAVIVQVFLAGMAVFGEGFRTHVAFGYSAIWVVALLIPPLAWAGRMPRADLWLSVLLLGLYVPQCLLPPIARSGGPAWISAFHPVNAMLLFALGTMVAWRAWQNLRREPRPSESG